MDTRSKIISGKAEITGSEVFVVAGYFDPLLAWHAERLAELKPRGAKLAVVVVDPPEPILPARARAEMVAGLAVVDHVMIEGNGALSPQVTLDHEDLDRHAALIAHVHSRQSAS